MISFQRAALERAAGKIGPIPHLEVLKQDLPEIFISDTNNSYSKTGSSILHAGVFNLERGTRLKQIKPFFKYHTILSRLDVIFANELDWGMKRTGNVHVTRELAENLQMNYAFAVEFVTMAALKDGNEYGLHGNAILSRYPLQRVKIVHLPIAYDWFYREGDPRLGVRCAMMAEINVPDIGNMGVVSVHLENRATPIQRAEQLAFLFDQIEAHFGNLPILVGGDMNTNTVDGNNDGAMQALNDDPSEQWRRLGRIPQLEPQLNMAVSRGYDYSSCNIMEKTTRRKPMKDGRMVYLNLDWFYQKGLSCSNPLRVESIFRMEGLMNPPSEVRGFTGQELSDHDIVCVSCGRGTA